MKKIDLNCAPILWTLTPFRSNFAKLYRVRHLNRQILFSRTKPVEAPDQIHENSVATRLAME